MFVFQFKNDHMNYKLTSSAILFIVCFSFILFAIGPSFAQGTSAANKGMLQFEQEIIDFGTVAYNAEGSRTFSFMNIGEAPVIITNVKTSCGCTVAKKPKKPVMPGETSKIKVSYDTKRVGGFSKRITVMSNASNARQVLTIKGNVLPKESMK